MRSVGAGVDGQVAAGLDVEQEDEAEDQRQRRLADAFQLLGLAGVSASGLDEMPQPLCDGRQHIADQAVLEPPAQFLAEIARFAGPGFEPALLSQRLR